VLDYSQVKRLSSLLYAKDYLSVGRLRHWTGTPLLC
jgi:hypothetical protein